MKISPFRYLNDLFRVTLDIFEHNIVIKKDIDNVEPWVSKLLTKLKPRYVKIFTLVGQ